MGETNFLKKTVQIQKLFTQRRRHLLRRPDAPTRRPQIRSSPFTERGLKTSKSTILNCRLAFVGFEIWMKLFECLCETSAIAMLRSFQSLSRSPDGIGDFLSNQKGWGFIWPPYFGYSPDCRWTATSRKVTSSFIGLSHRLDHEQVGRHITCCVVWFLLTLKYPMQAHPSEMRNATMHSFTNALNPLVQLEEYERLRPRSVSSSKWFRSLDCTFLSTFQPTLHHQLQVLPKHLGVLINLRTATIQVRDCRKKTWLERWIKMGEVNQQHNVSFQ